MSIFYLFDFKTRKFYSQDHSGDTHFFKAIKKKSSSISMCFSPHDFQCQHLLGSSASQMTERDKSESLMISPTSGMKTSLMGKATLCLKFPVTVMHEHTQHFPDLTRPFQFLQTLGDAVCAGILLLCTSFKVQLTANHST